MARVTRRTRREMAVWLMLYVYSAQLLSACAPTSQGGGATQGGVAHATFALEASFVDSYRLSAPDQDSYMVDGGIRARTPFTYEVSADGESRVSIPLVAPPGRNGIEPHLSFVYRDRANQGLLGRRWDLAGLSRIDPCAKNRAFDGRWSESGPDELCLDGQRLLPAAFSEPASATVLQSLDGNTRVLVPFPPQMIQAQDRDGTVREYRPLPGVQSTPATFFQTVARDTWGNQMSISYNDDGSPQSVSYTSNGNNLAATRFVIFSYEPRVVATSRAEGRRLLVNRNRLKAVTMMAPGNLNGPAVFVRRYKLAYTNSEDVLASVTECVPTTHSPASGVEADEVCLDPVAMGYDPSTPYLRKVALGGSFPAELFAESRDVNVFNVVGHLANVQAKSLSVLDVDGDGINDIVFMKPGPAPYTSEGGCFGFGLRHEVTHGRWYWRRGSITNGTQPAFAPEADLGLGDLSMDNASFPPRAMDFDGDGAPEFVAGITSRCFSADWKKDWFTGAYSLSDLRTISLQLAVRRRDADGALLSPMATFDSKALLADFDGDGLIDRVEIQPDRWAASQLTASDNALGSSAFLKSGTPAIRLNNSTASTVSFQDPVSLLTENPCGGWSGAVLCGKNCGYNCPPCSHCASENVPHDARFGENDCVSASACPANAVTFDEPYSPATVPSRISSLADMLAVDLDGNGVNDFVFREAVPEFLLDVASEISGFGDAWNEAGAAVPSELPGAQYYSGRLGAGTSSVRTKLAFVSPNGYYSEGVRFIDLNGDGLPDATYLHKGVLTAHMNLGYRVFGAPIELNLATQYPDDTFGGVPVQAALTANGRANVIVGTRVLEMRGDQWGEADFRVYKPTAATRIRYPDGAYYEGGDRGALGRLAVDLNNDGMTDFLDFDGLPGQQPVMFYWLNESRQGFLSAISQGVIANNVEHVRYSGAGAVCALPQNCRTPDGLYVVSKVVAYNERERAAEYLYNYGDPKTDVNGGGWLGFTSRTVTAPARGYRRSETYPIALSDRVFGTGGCSGCYVYPGARRPSVVVTSQDARLEGQTTPGQVITRTERFGYVDQRGDGTAGTFVSYLSNSWMTESATGVNGAAVAVRSQRTSVVRTRGTVTSQRLETWEGPAAADGSPPDSSRVKLVDSSTTLLPDDPANWLMGLPSRVTVSSKWPGSALVQRTVAYEYEVGKPVVKSVTVEPDSSEVEGVATNGYRLKSSYVRQQTYGVIEHVVEEGLSKPYDQAGAATRTRSSDLAYDQDWIFPRRVTNPLQQVLDLYHLPSSGALVGTSRPIDQASSARLDQVSVLDTVGRPVLAQASGSADVSIHYLPDRIEVRNASTGLETSYIDLFGRPVTVESTRSNGPVKVAYSYDLAGHITSASLPFTTRADWRTYLYDGLGRLVRYDDHAAGAYSTFDYQPGPSSDGYSWKTTINASSGARQELFTDAAGATAKTRELITIGAGGSVETWAEQRQTFGAFGQVTGVTDAANHQIRFEYDRLGRLVRTVDPDSGTRDSHYNAFNELVSVTSPLETIEFKRDQLARILSRRTTTSSGAAKVASFVWDQAPNAIGQLVSSSSEDQVGHSYSYDSLGRPQTETWTVDGQPYSTTMEYDAYSRLQYLTYPSLGSTGIAPRVKYIYASDGFVDRVEDARATSSLVFWQATQRNPAGLVTAATFGAYAGPSPRKVGVSEYVYDRANRPVYQATTDPQSSQVLLQLGYEYDTTGKGMKARHDRSEVGNFVTEQYEHDLGGRLTDWYVRQGAPNKACMVGAHEQFKYSLTGNIEVDQFLDLTGNVVNSPRPPVASTYGVGAGPSALTSQTGGAAASCTYDVTGNQLTQSGSTDRQATFNADGQLASAASPSGSWRMDYDAFGDRVRIQKLAGGQVVAGADTLEFGGLIARQPDGRLSFHVVVDNEVVAIISKTTSGSTWSEDVRYVFSDALGSPSAMVSSSGAVVDRPRYSPFGERRTGANLTSPSTARHPERLGFAAHVPDDDWGSVKMGVRSFDPRTTRFLSPDPLYNPGQQLNPYSYAANSPVNNVDPFGLSCAPTEPAAGWLCATDGTSVFTGFGGGAAAVTGPGPMAMPPLTPTAGPAVDDGSRGAPTPLSAGAAATAFGFGALKGAATGLGSVYALGAVAGVCPPCAVGLGAGLLVYGVYGLINGGAASLVASGTRIYNGVGTAEDFDSAGALLGGIASGGLSRSAFARGGADGVRALGAMKGILKPSSGCVAGSCSIAAEGPFRTLIDEEGIKVIEATTSQGKSLKVMFEEVREGSTLILRRAHIQGAKPGEIGLRELRDLARQYGKEQGAKQIVVEGAKRSTGAMEGKVQRPWVLDVE